MVAIAYQLEQHATIRDYWAIERDSEIVVACPPFEWDDELPDTLCNPIVIIEVLSPSTAAFGRGAKFAHYRHLDSLTDYILGSCFEKWCCLRRVLPVLSCFAQRRIWL